MPIEHLLVISPTPAPVQPARPGWEPYGAVQVKDLPGVSHAWIYGRQGTREAPPVSDKQAERRRTLFSGVWTPASQDELVRDLRLMFEPCEVEGMAT